ncbi:MAG: rhombotarget lipoprotein [Candidatus Electrothrix scaldis]|nr:MAG: rhombotarget lipoprotein [Candidatus Electrothrix sp. GW3-3]
MQQRSVFSRLTFLILMLSAFLLAGCGASTKQRSSSVVQFLYPNESGHIETPAIPRLALPLRVGIAFVPDGRSRRSPLTEKEKMALMQKVSSHFKQYDFVKSIDLIPSAYLQKNGSFSNLDQIRTMYGIDVIALISYDQTQFTDEGLASITYWTLIGAYVIPGEKNDTHTMVDTSVYDIASRKMLFRAPGISHIKSHATPVNLSEQLRKDSITGFKQASEELVGNLKIQLELFKDKVKESPGDYQIVHRPGYTGGGNLDLAYLLLLALAVGSGLWRRKSKQS